MVNGGCGNGIFAAAINNDDNAMALSAMVFIVNFMVLWRWLIVVAEMRSSSMVAVAVVFVDGNGKGGLRQGQMRAQG